MKRIGMVLAIAVLAGSILSGCVLEPGRYGDRGYYGDRNYYGDRGYYGGRGYYADRPGPYYHRDR